jgi:hypothetical protein
VTAETRAASQAAVTTQRTVWAVPLVCLLVGLLTRFAAFAYVDRSLSPALLPHAYCRWDCGYYLSVAAQNYQPAIDRTGQANWAFFPALPAAMAALHRLTGLPLDASGMIVATLATFIAARLAWNLCDSYRQYLLFSAALLVGPVALYGSIPYSESLFLLFTVLLQARLERNSFVGAGIAGALLSATRIVGIFAGAAIFVEFIAGHFRNGGDWQDLPAALWQRPDVLLGLAIAPFGLGLFILVLYLRTGDGLAFLHIQRLWYRELSNPAVAIWHGLRAGNEEMVRALATILGLLGVVVLLARGQYAMGIFCALCILAPLLTGIESMYRFVVALAPLWLLLSAGFAPSRWRTALGFTLLLVTGFLTEIAWLSNAHYLV